MAEPLLAVTNLSRRFGGVLAVDGVSIAADEGRITGLIGPNGAGKTTLFGLISGFVAPNEGEIRYAGEPITRLPTHERARRGIARTFQIVQPFAGLTVRENIVVGAHLRHRARADAVAAADVVGREVGLGGMLDRPADTLTVAGRKRLADAIIACGLPHIGRGDLALAARETGAIQAQVAGLRRFGAAALDLAWIAAGRLDGYWERDIKPWDMAAGSILVREAGGFVSDCDGGTDMFAKGHIVAGNEAIQKELLWVLKAAGQG